MLRQLTEVLAFLTALLGFVGVSVKVFSPIWRHAKERGRQRHLILFVFVLLNLVVYAAGGLGVAFRWNPLATLGCLVASLLITILTFRFDPSPLMTRQDVVAFLIGIIGTLILIFAEVNLIDREVAERKAKNPEHPSSTPATTTP